MNNANPKDPVSEFPYEVAKKLLDEMIKKLLNKAFEANGIPLPLAEPHRKLFSEYGKKMVELYRSTLKYDAHWTELVELTNALDRNANDIMGYIKNSPHVSAEPFGPAIFFEALLSPASAQEAIENREELRRGASDLIEKFDGLLSGQEEILAFTTAVLKKQRVFLDMDVAQNNFDVVLGRGSLVNGAGNLCFSASKFHEAYLALLSHRNEWARISSSGSRRARSLGELASFCPV